MLDCKEWREPTAEAAKSAQMFFTAALHKNYLQLSMPDWKHQPVRDQNHDKPQDM